MTLLPTPLTEIAAAIPGYDANLLSITQAVEFISRLVEPISDVEIVALFDALGRTLAADLLSTIAVPAFTNSAMDGYALRAADLAADGSASLRIAATVFAGRPFSGEVPPGSAARIMTGGMIPAGLDTVAAQELTRVADGIVTLLPGAAQPGDNVRQRGEDLNEGEVALQRGRVLNPADIGLAASLGCVKLTVMRRLRIAYLSTGDEIRSAGEALNDGSIYDSNRYTVNGMLRRLGCEVVDLGVVADDPGALETQLIAATDQADAIISSGGVSVGVADHTREVMARLGDVVFWRLAMRPGRPFAVGRIKGPQRSALLFALPGNPVAAMVSFYALVRDAILRLGGATPERLLMVRAIAEAPLRKRPGRTEYLRGVVSIGSDGRATVRLTGDQGSGLLRGMSQANGLIVLPHDSADVAAGETVDVLPFSGLM
jgi:molybdopterin molybdotransferase